MERERSDSWVLDCKTSDSFAWDVKRSSWDEGEETDWLFPYFRRKAGLKAGERRMLRSYWMKLYGKEYLEAVL